MIEIFVLPENKKIRLNHTELTLGQLLELLNISDLESVAVLINNKLVSEKNYVVKKGDRIVLIKQATGG